MTPFSEYKLRLGLGILLEPKIDPKTVDTTKEFIRAGGKLKVRCGSRADASLPGTVSRFGKFSECLQVQVHPIHTAARPACKLEKELQGCPTGLRGLGSTACCRVTGGTHVDEEHGPVSRYRRSETQRTSSRSGASYGSATQVSLPAARQVPSPVTHFKKGAAQILPK